jgi:uncharacterized membrane protein YsdA (DUF1294 family)
MAQFELVWAPLIIAFVLSLMACWVMVWRKRKLIRTTRRVPGSALVLILGLSFLLLSGISLFVGLFFLITG